MSVKTPTPRPQTVHPRPADRRDGASDDDDARMPYALSQPSPRQPIDHSVETQNPQPTFRIEIHPARRMSEPVAVRSGFGVLCF